MQLCRVGAAGEEHPAARTADGRLLDLSALGTDIGPEFFTSGGLQRAARLVADGDLPVVAEGQRIGPPISRPGKIVCIGLNYFDHARETGAQPPAEPVVFMKAGNTMVGPYDEVLVPRRSTKTDWEVELGVVIGSPARYLDSEEAALAAVGGYVLSHDVSEREFQLERGGQWDKGKSCETFNPLGPVLVTADDVPDPQQIGLRCWVNGQLRQNGSTKDMIFSVAAVVLYLSQFMVLEPGDLINTGTPAGVALGMPGQPYLRAGDVVELEADGLGRQRQVFGQA